MQIWQTLNGHKTFIAGMLAMASVFITQVVLQIWLRGTAHTEVVYFLDNTVQTLDWFSLALGGVGVTHKVVKALTPDV